MLSSLLSAFCVFALAASTPTVESTSLPLVTLDYGTFQGFHSSRSTESFLGVPFAQPPLGELRFNPPVPPKSFSAVQNATQFGDACPQSSNLGPNTTLPNDIPGLDSVVSFLTFQAVATSEDCLYLNVIRPAEVSANAHLPVVVWIYGGGFEWGEASSYDGIPFVSRSVDLKSPIIYVSFNYRLNAFGFLGGKEVQAAGLGNIGLRDQRFALEWVQRYISLFGGNPEQVIIWGESAGSVSVFLQMVAYDGQWDGLFQGAVMESGSALPTLDITYPYAQDNYDLFMEKTNCTSANNTLDCLRRAPYQTIVNIVSEISFPFSYQSLNLSWAPQVDDVFLKQSARQSLSQGKYAHVPVIIADVDDEGTFFSLFNLNVTTNEQFLQYIQQIYLAGISEDDIHRVGQLYPENPIFGSPYGVGTNDTLTPQYKRISSFQGDFYFQAPRRYSLANLHQTQNVWSYLWKRNKFSSALGSFHGSDLQELYNMTGTLDWVGTDMLVNFAYTLNPNFPEDGYPPGAASSLLCNISWPQYTPDSPQLLTFEDPNILTITSDTFRVEPMAFLNELQEKTGL